MWTGLFAPLARWVGVYGIGFVAAWLMAFIALYAMQKHDGEEATQVALLVLGLVSWTWWLNQEMDIGYSYSILYHSLLFICSRELLYRFLLASNE